MTHNKNYKPNVDQISRINAMSLEVVFTAAVVGVAQSGTSRDWQRTASPALQVIVLV